MDLKVATRVTATGVPAAAAVLFGLLSHDAPPAQRAELSVAQMQINSEVVHLSWLGPRSLANEARVRAILDHAFETSPGIFAPYRVVCDHRFCSFAIDETTYDFNWWSQRAQRHMHQAGMTFSGILGVGTAYFAATPPGEAAGNRWMSDVTDAFERAADECVEDNSRDRVFAVLRPDLDTRRSTFEIVKPGPTTHAAICASAVLAGILRDHPRPDDVTYVWKSIPLMTPRH